MPVIKANAYGHGMIQVADKLRKLNNNPEYFGVALYEEGAELRKAGIEEKILVFEPVSENSIQEIYEFDLIPTISNIFQVNLFDSARKANKLKVHLKLDSGMGRVGATTGEFIRIAEAIDLHPVLELDGIYTHFACSDETYNDYSFEQLQKFNFAADSLKNKGIRFSTMHAANSGAIINLPDSQFDMVRPGIALYGYNPSNDLPDVLRLQPAMSLMSVVEDVRRFPPGNSISYGRLYKTTEETNIITVPIGYADGVSRNLTNSMSAIISGKIYPQVGRITMDRIMFDVGDDGIKKGEKVTLLGNSESHSISAWDWSALLDTIPYEITCNISKRVPRIYV